MGKRFGLVVHSSSEAISRAIVITKQLQKMGAEVLAEEPAAAQLFLPSLSLRSTPCQMVLSLGGDGTLLRGVQWALIWGAPLLGINMGRLGFLTEAEPDRLEDVLPRLMDGGFSLEDRGLLRITSAGQTWTALNDAVITRGGYARLITMEVRVNEEWMGKYVADGMVVATPTGSTAYSLAAGGPVVSPDVDCTIVTPICAHSLQHRPTLTKGDAMIRLTMGDDQQQRAVLQVDGRNCLELHAGDEVQISRAHQKLQLVRLNDLQFYNRVHNKLKEWTQ